MARRLTACLLLALIVLASGCRSGASSAASSASPPASPEPASRALLTVINVGKGDALLLQTDNKAYLIDAGKLEKWGAVQSALKRMGVSSLDAVFLTHTDNDHAEGLGPLALSSVEVKRWYASAYYASPKKESKHPAVMAAAERGQQVTFLKAGDVAEGIFRVLAPVEPDDTEEDENSLILRCTAGGVTLLFTGDIEAAGEEALLRSGADVSCDVLKVPHHGEGTSCSDAFIEKTGASLALISTSSKEKPGTPDPLLLQSFEDAGIPVFCTEEGGAGILVTLENGKASAEYLPEVPEGPEEIAFIEEETTDTFFLLRNTGAGEADLSGWYMVAENKEAFFVFPEGTVLNSGELLSVGLMTEEDCDLVWDEKSIFTKKKTDYLTLYDADGHMKDYYIKY